MKCFYHLHDKISIHASAKEATRSRRTPRLRHTDFNPRLREGGDDTVRRRTSRYTISIHASAKEATQFFVRCLDVFPDFNPRLREGGDNRHLSRRSPHTYFNPRLREGGDLLYLVVVSDITISIHASAKEATTKSSPDSGATGFQSTPPRRRRRTLASGSCTSCPHFNPRLREGGDDHPDRTVHTIRQISIHASAKEATRHQSRLDLFSIISIHASAKEATIKIFQGEGQDKFQSTPPRRRRPQHIVIPQLSCTYLVSTTFLSAIFSFISQYVVLFFLF